MLDKQGALYICWISCDPFYWHCMTKIWLWISILSWCCWNFLNLANQIAQVGSCDSSKYHIDTPILMLVYKCLCTHGHFKWGCLLWAVYFLSLYSFLTCIIWLLSVQCMFGLKCTFDFYDLVRHFVWNVLYVSPLCEHWSLHMRCQKWENMLRCPIHDTFACAFKSLLGIWHDARTGIHPEVCL